MATQTKKRPQKSESKVSENGMLILAPGEQSVRKHEKDCALFKVLVERGFKFPGFEKVNIPEPKLEKPRNFKQIIAEKNVATSPVIAMFISALFLFLGFGGTYPIISSIEPVRPMADAIFSALFSVFALVYFRYFFWNDEDFRDSILVYLRAIKERWNEPNRVKGVNKERRQAAERDSVTEEEVITYLADFLVKEDKETIKQLREHKAGLEAEKEQMRNILNSLSEEVENASDELKERFGGQPEDLKFNGEAHIAQINKVIDRIDQRIKEVEKATKEWIENFVPEYKEEQRLANILRKGNEIMRNSQKMKQAEKTLAEVELRLVERTAMLARSMDEAKRYNLSLAEAEAMNYRDLSSLLTS